jgi:hypothetical protein
MPLVRLLVSDEKRDETFAVLRDTGADFVIHTVEERDASLVSFPVPTGAVQGVLDHLRDEGSVTATKSESLSSEWQ